MDTPLAHKILTGTLVVFVRRKSVVYQCFSMSEGLKNALSHEVDPARGFAALAEIAARTHAPCALATSPIESRWNRLFGELKIDSAPTNGGSIFGTIIINAEVEDFCSQIDNSDVFVLYLLRAFMRKENPAEALSFLAEFAVDTCNITKLSSMGILKEA